MRMPPAILFLVGMFILGVCGAINTGRPVILFEVFGGSLVAIGAGSGFARAMKT